MADVWKIIFMQRLLIFVFTLLTLRAFAQDTAYQALRTLSSAKGSELLNKVIAVRGSQGAPQPKTWLVYVNDTDARGGVREFEISGVSILSERTPVRRSLNVGNGGAMDFSKLNLDSTGAFTIAEKEAVKSQTGFDRVNYQLAGDDAGRPVWTLNMVATGGPIAGTVQLAAENGAVLQRTGFGATTGETAGIPNPDGGRPRKAAEEDEDDSFGAKLGRFGGKVEKHFVRDGAVLQEFFTGRRTIDRKYRDQEENAE